MAKLLLFLLVLTAFLGCSEKGGFLTNHVVTVAGPADAPPTDLPTSTNLTPSTLPPSTTAGQEVTSDEPDPEPVTNEEIAQCAALAGDAARLSVIANKSDVTLATETSMLLYVKGNKSRTHLRVQGKDANQILEAVCLIIRGNKAAIDVEIATHVRKVLYLGKGNKSQGNIVVQANGRVDDLQVELKGNKATILVSGEGNFSCSQVSVKGNKADAECRK
jgi:hypothetical protein